MVIMFGTVSPDEGPLALDGAFAWKSYEPGHPLDF